MIKIFDQIFICRDDLLLFFKQGKIDSRYLIFDTLSKAKEFGKEKQNDF